MNFEQAHAKQNFDLLLKLERKFGPVEDLNSGARVLTAEEKRELIALVDAMPSFPYHKLRARNKSKDGDVVFEAYPNEACYISKARKLLNGEIVDPACRTKRCSNCGETFPLSHFSKVDNTKSGYLGYCKDCEKCVIVERYGRDYESEVIY